MVIVELVGGRLVGESEGHAVFYGQAELADGYELSLKVVEEQAQFVNF